MVFSINNHILSLLFFSSLFFVFSQILNFLSIKLTTSLKTIFEKNITISHIIIIYLLILHLLYIKKHVLSTHGIQILSSFSVWVNVNSESYSTSMKQIEKLDASSSFYILLPFLYICIRLREKGNKYQPDTICRE